MTFFRWSLFEKSLYRITFLTLLCGFTVMFHLKHHPQNWQSPIKVVAVVAGKEITYKLMRCNYGCPWYTGLWCLSEVSAGLLPEPAWSFMPSHFTRWLVYGFILCSSSSWLCIDDQAFSYLLLPLTSVTLVTESIPAGPQETWLTLSMFYGLLTSWFHSILLHSMKKLSKAC